MMSCLANSSLARIQDRAGNIRASSPIAKSTAKSIVMRKPAAKGDATQSLRLRSIFPRHGVDVRRVLQDFLRPGAIGIVGRRGLISGRRLGQVVPGRLALERRGLDPV